MPINEGGPGPYTVDRAADAAFEAIEKVCNADGRVFEKAFLIMNLIPDDSGEPDATTAGHGYDDGRELFADLVGHVVGVGQQMGLEIVVAPMTKAQG